MKKSTGILLFVVFIFIIMVLNSKKTEHFLGLVCDAVDAGTGRCGLKSAYMDSRKYVQADIRKWSEECDLVYDTQRCDDAKVSKDEDGKDRYFEKKDTETGIVSYGNEEDGWNILAPAPGENDELCRMIKSTEGNFREANPDGTDPANQGGNAPVGS